MSRIQIAGAAGTIDDDFVSTGTRGQPYVLNTNIWTLNAADRSGVFITAPDAKYWVTWPLPDYGFTNLYVTDNLARKLGGGQWLTLPTGATGWLNGGGGERVAVINQSTLNAAFLYQPTNVFFGLFHE